MCLFDRRTTVPETSQADVPFKYHGKALTVSRRHHVFMPCLWTVPRMIRYPLPSQSSVASSVALRPELSLTSSSSAKMDFVPVGRLPSCGPSLLYTIIE
jgi:hypothetical protein